MDFLSAIESGLKGWTTFSGRASRSEYWYFVLFYWIIYLIEQVESRQLDTLAKIAKAQGHAAPMLILACAYFILAFVLLWCCFSLICLVVRRLHDVNRSGWWYWIVLTLIGIIFPLFVWKCTKGTEGDNRFGPDPLQKVPYEPVL